MCGFAGMLAPNRLPGEQSFREAGDLIRHRGPDYQGLFYDDQAGTAAVHQRLSIIDLDPRSNQPFVSPDGRYRLVFNGEIYNYRELRAELKKAGEAFQTESDTEVLLRLLTREGVEGLTRLNGMFALALWDSREQSWFITRDRMGIKPLYYFLREDLFAFASDLKSFQAWRSIPKRLHLESLRKYLYFGYIPQPQTIYKDVFKILPGHWLKITQGREPEFGVWWKMEREPNRVPFGAPQFRELLQDSIQSRMVSDVEVGSFSSGGLDSSAIVALMEAHERKTFTIGFEHQSNPLDLIRSKELASELGLNQHITMLGQNSLEGFSDLLAVMDEPLSEASILPLFHNYRVAKEHGVKVILSGDGADELLGGYSYFNTLSRHQDTKGAVFRWSFRSARFLTKGLLGFLKANSKAGKFRDLYLLKTFEALGQWQLSGVHELVLSQNNRPDVQQLMGLQPKSLQDDFLRSLYATPQIDWGAFLKVETQTALVNKHLAKVDKASMANSIEARVPFLDHRIAEAANRMPRPQRTKKTILKQAMEGVLPSSIIHDRKRGFNLPLKPWVREFITAPGSDLLDKQSLESLGVLSIPSLDHLIRINSQGRQDHSRTIWSLFVLSQWLKNNHWEAPS